MRVHSWAMTVPDDFIEDYDCEVMVIGGGMVGMSLAVALAGAGLEVAVIERFEPGFDLEPDYDGRTSAIAHGSVKIFEGIGAWPFMAAEAGPMWDIRVVDGNLSDGVSSLFLHYDHQDIGDDPFGYIIENRVIRTALARRAAQLPNLELIAPGEIASLERDAYGARATTTDGDRVTARLAIAAEGKFSPTRQAAGIKTRTFDYGQSGIVCTLGHEHRHDGVAVELFLPSGPFAMLPMTGERMNIVWTEKTELVPAFLEMDEEAFLVEVSKRFGDWLGPLKLIGPRFAYPLALQLSERYTDERLALVGDAAHVIHPIAGQGLNLGLRDVAALAEVIVDARRLGLDVGSGAVLEQYADWRQVDTMTLAAVTDFLNRLFSNDMPTIRTVRDLGLAAVNGLPPLKKLFMRHAMGTVGDLPRLIAGEPL